MYLYITSNLCVTERFGCFIIFLNIKKNPYNIMILKFFFVICNNKMLPECLILVHHHRSPSVAFQG